MSKDGDLILLSELDIAAHMIVMMVRSQDRKRDKSVLLECALDGSSLTRVNNQTAPITFSEK
jgi:hypothetical protein